MKGEALFHMVEESPSSYWQEHKEFVVVAVVVADDDKQTMLSMGWPGMTWNDV